jgi:hypothetical protein
MAKRRTRTFVMRALVVLLAYVCVAALAPPAAYAAGATVTARPPAGDVAPGEAFSVSFDLSGNPGFWGATLTVDYDESALVLTGFDVSGALFASGSVTENVAGASIEYHTGSATANTTGDGTLFRASFRAKAGASEGAYQVGAQLRRDNAKNFINKDYESVAVSFAPASVTVSTSDGGSGDGGGGGDGNGDGGTSGGSGGNTSGGGSSNTSGGGGGGSNGSNTSGGGAGGGADGSDTEADGSGSAASAGASAKAGTSGLDATGATLSDAATPLGAAGTDANSAQGSADTPPWLVPAVVGVAIVAAAAGAMVATLINRRRNKKDGSQPA